MLNTPNAPKGLLLLLPLFRPRGGAGGLVPAAAPRPAVRLGEPSSRRSGTWWGDASSCARSVSGRPRPSTTQISGSALFLTPLVLAGFSPTMVSAALGLNLLYQLWLHTELIGRLGPLEWVLNTPSHHRVHHASNDRYLDRNLGGVLIVFDRLFGTFAEERADEACRYGLVEPLESNNPIRIAFHTWQKLLRDLRIARGVRESVQALFGPPEWRPLADRSAPSPGRARAAQGSGASLDD